MAVFSCLNFKTIPNKCVEYAHPWTDSCRDATLGLLLQSLQHSFRTYTTLYVATALMKRKKPSMKLVKDTLAAILQSTIFLTTHAYGFSMCLCSLRRLTGSFSLLSAAFLPAFLSSLVAIHLERPSRRPILCLYVTNIAMEALFRMAVDRGLIKPVPFGEVVIFTVSAAFLMYRYRGDHSDDSIFSLIRFLVGKSEERFNAFLIPAAKQPTLDSGVSKEGVNAANDPTTTSKANRELFKNRSAFPSVLIKALQVYSQLIKQIKALHKTSCCPHEHSCIYYFLHGGCKMLAVGYGVQVLLRFFLSLKKIWRKPSMLYGIAFNKSVLNLGAFLGLFSGTFRGCCCLLRWARGKDAQEHALPAGLLAGLAFCFYPDNTAALYVFLKAIQVAYTQFTNAGGPQSIPFSVSLLYTFSTAVLFHAAFLEPKALRSSYVRFLDGLSGGRMVAMSRLPLDQFGLKTSQQLLEVITKLNMNPNPRYSLKVFGNCYPPLPKTS